MLGKVERSKDHSESTLSEWKQLEGRLEQTGAPVIF